MRGASAAVSTPGGAQVLGAGSHQALRAHVSRYIQLALTGRTILINYTPASPGDLVLDVTTQVPTWSIRVPVRVTNSDGRNQ